MLLTSCEICEGSSCVLIVTPCHREMPQASVPLSTACGSSISYRNRVVMETGSNRRGFTCSAVPGFLHQVNTSSTLKSPIICSTPVKGTMEGSHVMHQCTSQIYDMATPRFLQSVDMRLCMMYAYI